jgi:predicted Zn-dependent protease
MRALLLILAMVVVSGCSVGVSAPRTQTPPAAATDPELSLRAERAARQFVSVMERMEPVAEQVCREQRSGNCDFLIVIDDRVGQPPNAFQTIDRRGRPILAFNLALITSVRNADELAFVVGHEAAHHIARHLDRQEQNAALGAAVFGEAASAVFGGNIDAIRAGQEFGAVVGARSYSKDFELEADALGTVITHRAGFDPVRGAEFFGQLPDPDNRFLGTHPPNAARVATVRRVAAGLER